MILGALEAGGTKMVCALGDETGRISEQVSIPTTIPAETIPQIIDYFKDKKIESLGVASFGPIDLDKASPTYGYITSTPKKGWGDYNLLGELKAALNVPMGFDTDVNGSLLGEVTYGSSKGISDAVYITVGTGVGGGVMSGGNLVHGMLHPELGHMKMVPHSKDTFPGRCPFHKNCLEGMACGPAIGDRWGRPAKELYDNELVWEMEAYYIAQALANIIVILSPKRIILGGGVMHRMELFPLIREKTAENLNGYLKTKELASMDEYIVPASLNDDQGIMGCIKLALDALEEAGR
ncbi:MAG: ROK family protein [Lachnospiraceae bacterium]|nr:ROK family protein [Lachnospiraceae bacterium]